MKNRLLIFFLSSIFIGILFSFSMLCHVTTGNNGGVSAASNIAMEHSKHNGSGKKKVCKEFNKVKKQTKDAKVKNHNASANIGAFTSTDYNLYFENKILNYRSVNAKIFSLEEIRTTILRI